MRLLINDASLLVVRSGMSEGRVIDTYATKSYFKIGTMVYLDIVDKYQFFWLEETFELDNVVIIWNPT